ncbi:MAG: hypothetical protein MJ033_01055 [Victivallaceae bacterium]|nr:hypothetical protein [Victivallaceae bacterium]
MKKGWIHSALTAALLCVAGCETNSLQPTKENSPLLADPGAKKMKLISVVNFYPDAIPFMVEDAKRAYAATSVDHPAYLFMIYPSRRLEKTAEDAEAFGKLQAGLKDSGVKPGILITTSVGQGWKTCLKVLYEPMEYSVNQLGELNYRMCLRDPKFRKHIHDAIVIFAKRHPAFFLMDDDFRQVNNSAYGAECFCKSHMKIYNERMPRKFASDRELVAYLEKAPADDPCVKVFEAVRRETLLSHAKLIRDAIDEVDPSIPCGYCSGGAENIMAGDIARALAGKNESFLRIHNANFQELEPQQFNIVMYRGAYAAKMAGKVDYILDESDTLNRHRFSKSAVSMHSHITGGILYGMSGAKLWLYNLLNKDVQQSNREYEDIVKKHHAFYDALLAEMAHVAWQGPTTPIINERDRFNATHTTSGVGFVMDMQVLQLNRYGIPAQYDFIGGNRVYLVNRQIAKAMTDQELKTVLSGKAVVDGHAALEIARRGMADYLGCLPKVEEIYPHFEQECRDEKHRIYFESDGSVPNLTEVSPDAEIWTRIIPGEGAENKGAKLGPGMIVYKNPYGGTVVTRAMAVGVSRVNDEWPELKRLYVKMFRRLDPALVPFYIGEDQPVHLRCGKHDRGGYLLALVNLSFDAMTEIDLRTTEKVSSVEFLDGDGIYKPLNFTKNAKGIVVEKALPCYAPLILRVR